jgi:hypothetical protein
MLGVGVIPFLAGMLVSWQLGDIPRGIAITLLVGWMGVFGAVILTFMFGHVASGGDGGTAIIEICIVLTIPLLLLGCLASLIGWGLARLQGIVPRREPLM